MDFRAEHQLSHPVEQVFAAYRDRLVELVPYLDDIQRIEVLERHDEEGGTTRITNRWHVSPSQVPGVVRPFVPQAAISWLDHARWDQEALTCTWEYELGVLPGGAVGCAGVNYFRARPGGGSTLEITGALTINAKKLRLPFLFRGAVPKIERYLVGRLRPSLDAVGRAVERRLSGDGAAG